MKKFIVLLFAVFMFLSVEGKTPKVVYQVPDIPVMNEWKNVNFIHIDYDGAPLQVGDKIKAGDLIGHITAYPAVLSKNFDNQIRLSKEYYNQRDYAKASEVLKRAAFEEPDNLFVANYYARACYWTDRAESFRVYQGLVSTLDSMYNTPEEIAIDLWFREAYWKLGTLYMDNGQFDKAYVEISRSQASIQDMKGTTAYTQGLQYLTECAFEMNQDELAAYLAKRTLKYDRKNEYARGVLKEVKKRK